MRRDVVNASQNWRGWTPGAKLLISLVVAAGTGVLLYGAIHPTSKNIAQFICYLLISTLASGLKVNLPGITGTMSVNFLFILLGIIELSLPETMLIAWTATLFQSLWKTKTRPMPVQILFNVSSVAIATLASYQAFHHVPMWNLGLRLPLMLV